MPITSKSNYLLIAFIALLFMPIQALAANCNSQVTDLNFGTISVRSGVTNQTSGLITITCEDVIGVLTGVCIDFGPGSGGSANSSNSPRFLRNGQGTALAYELRPNGNGASNGTLNRLFISMPVVLGRSSVVLPFYADVVSNGAGLQAGLYQSIFFTGSVTAYYGVESCNSLGDEEATSPFTIRSNVSSSCEVDNTALNFGNLSSVISSSVDQLARVTVRCTDETPFALRMGLGNGPSVTNPEYRRMSNGLGTIEYGLYQNSARTLPWGDTPSTDVRGVGHGSDQTFDVFGRVHSNQSALPGVYSDQVIITIEY